MDLIQPIQIYLFKNKPPITDDGIRFIFTTSVSVKYFLGDIDTEAEYLQSAWSIFAGL